MTNSNKNTHEEAYAQPGHNSQALRDEIEALAHDQVRAERNVESIEQELKSAKEILREISESRLPELLEQFGFPEMKTDDGLVIQLKEEIKTHVNADNREIAADWLEKNDCGPIIKTELIIGFNKGEVEKARKLRDELLAKGFACSVERTVHHSTLKSIIGKLLQKGIKVPMDLFGVQRLRFSKIKQPKEKNNE